MASGSLVPVSGTTRMRPAARASSCPGSGCWERSSAAGQELPDRVNVCYFPVLVNRRVPD